MHQHPLQKQFCFIGKKTTTMPSNHVYAILSHLGPQGSKRGLGTPKITPQSQHHQESPHATKNASFHVTIGVITHHLEPPGSKRGQEVSMLTPLKQHHLEPPTINNVTMFHLMSCVNSTHLRTLGSNRGLWVHMKTPQ